MQSLESKNFASRFIGAMIFIIVGIMPLVVYGFELNLPPELEFLVTKFGFENPFNDFLVYGKVWMFVVPVALVVFYFLSELVTGGIKKINFMEILKTPPVMAVLVFIVMAVLSAAFSAYRHTALFGTKDRQEGIFLLIAFMTAFIIALRYFRSQEFLKSLLAGLIFSSIIMGAIGLFQMFEMDFFSIPFVQELLLGETVGMSTRFNIAFGTLFNPNTYGLYAAMMFPVLLLCGFTYRGAKAGKLPWVNVLLIIAGLLMLGGVPASNSLGGLMGAAAAVVVLAVTYVAHLIYGKGKIPRPLWVSVLALLAAAVGLVLFVPVMRTRVAGFAEKFYHSMVLGGERPDDYAFDGNQFKILTADGAERVVFEFNESPWVTVTDGSGAEFAPLSLTYNEEATEADRDDANPYGVTLTYDVSGYGAFSFAREHGYMYMTRADQSLTVIMGYEDGKAVPLLADASAIDLSVPVEYIGFEGNERFATMRGYIWSRSFPLMLKTPILGTGPDSFINEFPQYDVIGKLRAYGNLFVVVDKAHNLYIHTWITTGGVSALALIFLYGFYLITTFLSLIKYKGENRFVFGLRLGLLAGISAYCVSSLSTDSTVASTGVFYILLGLGCAANAWETKTVAVLKTKTR